MSKLYMWMYTTTWLRNVYPDLELILVLVLVLVLGLSCSLLVHRTCLVVVWLA